jgi:hypothetical protein
MTPKDIREIDRNARAYGFEVGRGRPAQEVVTASPDNPFLDPDWASDLGGDDVSDGHHTFGELYDHRRALTAALCKALSLDAWRSKAHHPEDSPMFEGGYFIVGVNLPTGTITYHYKLKHWDDFAGVIELAHAPKWDGAAPGDTVTRLLGWTRA